MGSIYNQEERIRRIEVFCGITDMMIIDKVVFGSIQEEVRLLDEEFSRINENVNTTLQKIKESNILLSKTQLDLENAKKELTKYENFLKLFTDIKK